MEGYRHVILVSLIVVDKYGAIAKERISLTEAQPVQPAIEAEISLHIGQIKQISDSKSPTWQLNSYKLLLLCAICVLFTIIHTVCTVQSKDVSIKHVDGLLLIQATKYYRNMRYYRHAIQGNTTRACV